ncbi:MAG: hypothetical protein U0359_19135 [Byssovorax sp.]
MLKMRLVSPAGTPFADRGYRVVWNGKTIPEPPAPPEKTGTEGDLSMLLDAPLSVAPQGSLHVVDDAGGKETVVWSIPLQVVVDPPPTGLPGIDVAPTPPPAGATQREIEQYDDEMVRHRAKVLVQLHERLFELWQVWDDIERVVSVLPLPPEPGASDDDLWQAWQAFVEAYALVVNGYEAAFRLYNLADLPLDQEPSLPFLGADFYKLLRAMTRFAYRHKQSVPLPWPLTGTDVKPYLDEIIKTHDNRGPVSP